MAARNSHTEVTESTEFAGYTPGPWVVEDPIEGTLSIVEGGHEAYEWDVLASIPLGYRNGGKDAATAEANARLIASAPQLAERVKELEAEVAELRGKLAYALDPAGETLKSAERFLGELRGARNAGGQA